MTTTDYCQQATPPARCLAGGLADLFPGCQRVQNALLRAGKSDVQAAAVLAPVRAGAPLRRDRRRGGTNQP
jgi:hypothetical protein